ncbi:MAG: peptide ABC transporter substrate-binding protein [Bdellovibrionaceae bacterium]|nr:peptide ABC transporter substrate-binding protein [Bdellovibrionales bacterium]MCB9253690.1 peptide ABC transporter substrate-binding protein [Pseudobdellovibrionaceae bacterium]
MRTKGTFQFRSLFVAGPLVALLFSLVSFSAQSPAPQVLNWGNGTEVQDLDPHIVSGVPEHHIISELFEGLVTVHPQTLEPLPAQAESWTISKDGKIYTFKIRKDAKWTNGENVTANDFVYSWQRLVDPKTAAKYAYQGYYIKNGEAINKGKIKDLKQLGVKAVDAHTLQVELEAPAPFFLGVLYHYSLYPVHQKTVEKFGQRWTRPENIVSNGPFKLESWQLNKVLTVVKNPVYWDAAKVQLSKVNYWPVEKSDTEEKMFRAGELHVTNEIPLPKIPYWQRSKKDVYQQHPYLGTYYYRLNVTKKPLNDKRVRRALNLSIDREDIVKHVTRAGQIPALSFTPPGTGGFTPEGKLPPKVTPKTIAEAKKLLAEAGYPDGKGLPPIEILYNTLESHKTIAEAIQQMWKKNLGIEVKLFNQEWKVYLATMQTLNYQIARAGWIGDYNDPLTFLDMFITNGGNNETGFSNKEYDKLVRDVKHETNQAKRLKMFQRLEDILMDELPIVPIYTYTRVYLKDPKVAGWYPNVMDYHPLKFVSLK